MPGALRILQVARSISTIGGMETFVRGLSELLPDLGHETALVVTDAAPAGAPCPTWVIGGLLDRSLAAHATALAELERMLDFFGPDLVVTHQVADGTLLSWLDARAPTVEILHGFACHGSKLFRGRDAPCPHPVGPRCLWDWYAGPCGTTADPRAAVRSYREARDHLAALRRIRGVIVGSGFMRRYAIGEGIAADKVWLTDFEGMVPARPRRGPTGGEHSILFVGRLVYAKGVQYAIEALAEVGDEYSLTIVGEGWYRSALERLVERRCLGKRVRFTGWLTGSDLDDQYSMAGVLVVPSIWPEPVGLVVPEARRCGLPVAAFDVGGLPEWAEKYDGVHLARPADAGALASAIRSAAGVRAARPVPEPDRGAGASVVRILEHLAEPTGRERTLARP